MVQSLNRNMKRGHVVEYKEDHKSFGAFMVSPQVFKSVFRIAQRMKSEMRRKAPRSNDGDGVPYADSFHVESQPHYPKVGKYKAPRAAARIYNTAPHAPAIEFGIRSRVVERAPDGSYRTVGTRAGRRIMIRAARRYGNPPWGTEE